MEGGFISGCNVGGGSRGAFTISRLLLADDTVLLCDAKAECLAYVRLTLSFQGISGFRGNLGNRCYWS